MRGEYLQSLDDEQGPVIIQKLLFCKLRDALSKLVDHFLRRQIDPGQDTLSEPLLPILLAAGTRRLGDAVSVQDHDIARLKPREVLVIMQIVEHPQRHIAIWNVLILAVGLDP